MYYMQNFWKGTRRQVQLNYVWHEVADLQNRFNPGANMVSLSGWAAVPIMNSCHSTLAKSLGVAQSAAPHPNIEQT